MNHEDAKNTKTRGMVEELATEVVDAALEVHRTLGPGYLESVYEEALGIELELRNVACARQVPVRIRYKNRPVGNGALDMLVGGLLVVELKAVTDLLPIHTAQVISYLKATRLPLAMLLNFNVRYFRNGIRRVILT